MTANGKVRLGLYGCGNRTQALLNSLLKDNLYEVTAAYDLLPEKVRAVAERFGGCPCAQSRDLVERRDVDAFVISLDPFAHAAAFFETLEARKPIFIEKPIAMTAREARAMMVKAAEYKVPVQVGFMRRFLPEQVAAHRFLAENPPGRLFGVRCTWIHAGETEMISMLNHCPDNFRLKVSQIPFHCCHALDVMQTYGGEVKRVAAAGIKWVQRPYPSPDYVLATLEFANGALGHFHYSSQSFKFEISYLLHYENYTLSLNGDEMSIWRRPPFASLRNDGSQNCAPNYVRYTGPDKCTFGAYPVDAVIFQRFLDGVRGGGALSPGLDEGWRTAELAEAIERSWKERRPIDLPLTLDPDPEKHP